MSDTLMVGVSGVRGIVGKDLTEDVVTRYATAFGLWAREREPLVVGGRDARTPGPAFETAVVAGLASVGCDVVKVGLAPTPTIQLAVEHHRAGGGIAITASHNPIEWNALKFIGPDGVFLDGADAVRLQQLAVQSGEGREKAGRGWRAWTRAASRSGRSTRWPSLSERCSAGSAERETGTVWWSAICLRRWSWKTRPVNAEPRSYGPRSAKRTWRARSCGLRL